eukprot:CAMPEP_0115129720 /NCGR_PEP_ID=MMETSP0227-20121206/51969_1 /TAXON_ID=89957 /ORGANISM="Polarella glacialis, Strain CCMP 1383" /LENGTH=60 /DNA_ID=CAMNT_0002534663 /DNA_START=78 /DNA_END=256 /DNA_ORIENTATION=-
MADPTDDIRNMAQHLDLIEDVMAQPGGSDHADMVNEMLRECAEHRKKLEEVAITVIERDG